MTEKRRTTANLASAKRLIVKIGSALMVDVESGGIRRMWLDALADDVAALRERGTEEDVAGAYKTIRTELKSYSPVLAEKPEILCLNKCDALSAEEIEDKTKALIKAAKLKKGRAKNAPAPVLAISGAAKLGMTELLRRAYAVIQETRAREAEETATSIEAAQ